MKTSNILRLFSSFSMMLLLVSVSLAQSAQGQPAQKKKPTFWQRLIRFAGISATPSAQKAPGDEAFAGDIWVVQVNSAEALRLTNDGGYRSPIFLSGDKNILALKGMDVIELGLTGGQPRRLFCLKGVVKLVGLDMDDPNSILLLMEDQNRNLELGLLSLDSGQVTKIPPEENEDSRRALTHIQGWERAYGTTKVYVKTEVKNDLAGTLEWTDVYLKQADSEPRNISRCDGINCGQPSLSQNDRSVTYVKAQE